MDRNYDVITFIFILRRSRVANFAEIIKIRIMFIKTTFKDPNQVKRIRIQTIFVFLVLIKVADFSLCYVIYIFFGSSLCKI